MAEQWEQQQQQQQKTHQHKVQQLLGQVVTASKCSEFRLMGIKTSSDEAKRLQLAQQLDQKCLEKKNSYDQFMRDQSSNFVYEAQKFLKSCDNKLTLEEYQKFQELMQLRNKAWNAKGKSISIRTEKKNAFSRASTSHQNGEKYAEQLYKDYYKIDEDEKTLDNQLKQAHREFVTAYGQVDQELKKKLKSFIQEVDKFCQKAQEIFKYEEAEESENEEDKQFGKAFYEFEAMD
jgi:hypothetical protein